jgi:hypothetical protein
LGSKSLDQLMRESQLDEIEVGTRIAVYWPNYQQYFEAVVKLSAETISSPEPGLFVEYIDDGYNEWLDVRTEKFYVIGTETRRTWTQINMADLIALL